MNEQTDKQTNERMNERINGQDSNYRTVPPKWGPIKELSFFNQLYIPIYSNPTISQELQV